MKSFQDRYWIVILILITAFGGYLRFSGLDWGLPWRYHVDENAFINAANAMRKAPHYNHFNPKWFYHPSLGIYGVCAFSAIHSFFAPLSLPRVHLLGRLFSACFGTASIPMFYLLGRRLFGTGAGLLSALFLSVVAIHVQQSHFFTPDTALVFFLALTMFLSLGVLRRGRTSDYAVAGAACGAAMASKYWAPAALPILVAHIFRLKDGGFTWKQNRNFLLSLGGAALVFFLLSPYVVLDASFAVPKIIWWAKKTTGAIPQVWAYQFQGLPPYLPHLFHNLPWGMGLPLALLSGAGLIHCLVRHRREDILLVSWIVLNFLLIGSWHIKFARYLLPVIPFLCLAAGELSAEMVARTRQRWAGIAVAAVAFLWSGIFSLAFIRVYAVPHTKTQASEWIYSHVPPGATIVADASIPLGARNRLPELYRVREIDLGYLFDTPLSGEERQRYLREKTAGADYLVFSEDGREYFRRAAATFPVEHKFWDDLFSGRSDFEEIEVFRASPRLGPVELRDDGAELSWRSFDHPAVYVFRKKGVSRQER